MKSTIFLTLIFIALTPNFTMAYEDPEYVYYAEGWENPDKFDEHYQTSQDSFKYWDDALNKEYQRLMKNKEYSQEFKKSLKSSQLAWIKYRDLAQKAIIDFYDRKGTMYTDLMTFNIIRITKDRALELEALSLE